MYCNATDRLTYGRIFWYFVFMHIDEVFVLQYLISCFLLCVVGNANGSSEW
jgi:hypothetical protein